MARRKVERVRQETVQAAATGFLFWNLRGRLLQPVLRRLTVLHRVDVLMLAECSIPEVDLLETLNEGNPDHPFYRIPPLNRQRVELYSRFPPGSFGRPLFEANHYTIWRMAVPQGVESLLVVAHLRSALRTSLEDRNSRCCGFAQTVRDTEQRVSNTSTIVVGDFNLNPFDKALLDIRGFNSLSDVSTVQRKRGVRRTSHPSETFPLFYAPMWSHFGDLVAPSGTYFYDQANAVVDPMWHIYDQVLLRPGLLDRFRREDLRILTTDGATPLVRQDGRPRGDTLSDHLPIWFQLDLQRRNADGQAAKAPR